MSSDARTLYLLLTITFLAFLTALYLPVNENYSIALFTTISLPVVYSARYFSKAAVGEEDLSFFKVVSTKESIIKELTAVITAFVIGYIVYVATSRDFTTDGLLYFTIAFLIVLFLRLIIATWYKSAALLIDVDNPLVITVSSIGFAFLGFAIEWVVFVWGVIRCGV